MKLSDLKLVVKDGRHVIELPNGYLDFSQYGSDITIYHRSSTVPRPLVGCVVDAGLTPPVECEFKFVKLNPSQKQEELLAKFIRVAQPSARHVTVELVDITSKSKSGTVERTEVWLLISNGQADLVTRWHSFNSSDELWGYLAGHVYHSQWY